MADQRQLDQTAVPGRAWAVAVALLALFCTFLLPFLFPPTRQVYSAAYAAGSNNKLATVTLALLAVATFLYTWLRKPGAPGPAPETWEDRQSHLGPLPQTVAAALVTLWTAGLGARITQLHVRYGESTYFLERLRDVAQFHPALYQQIEFPYGPLLLLPAAWLAQLFGGSLDAGYWAFLTLLNVAGVLLSAYVLNRLPLGRAARWTLFALLCFEQLHPLLGPNYSLGKFVLPVAVLVWGTRRPNVWQQAAALAAGHLLTVLVSPELGVGLAAGIGAWAALAAWRTRSVAPLLCWLAPIAGYAAFFALYGRGFLDRLGNASAGALNLVIEPLPHSYILLVALVWLAPIAVALTLRNRRPEAPLLAGIFVLSLGLLPGALGRADPLHVFFNCWPLFALSAVGLRRLGRTRAALWLAALVVLGLQTQLTNFRIYSTSLKNLAHSTPLQPDIDAEALAAVTGNAPIATPALLTLSLPDELALRRAGLLPLDYEAGLADLWDAAGERQKIARMRQLDWALIPNVPFVQAEGSPNDAHLKVLLRGGYQYPQRQEPYRVGALVTDELARNWTVAQRFGSTVLLHRAR